MIRELIQVLLILLFGNNSQQPKYDLRKAPKRSMKDAVSSFVQRNFYIICLALIPILLIAFVLVCFAICGVSATESGAVYNGFGKVI